MERSHRLVSLALPLSALALAAGILIGRAADTSAWAMAAMLCAAIGILPAKGRMRLACVLLAVMSLGAVRGYHAYHPDLPAEGTYVVTGVVSDEIRVRGDQISTRLTGVTLGGVPAPTNAYWSFYADAVPEGLVPGREITVTARLYHPGGPENPGGFNFREYLLGEGVTYALFGADDFAAKEPSALTVGGMAAGARHSLVTQLTATMSGDAGAYAAAMLLGTKAYIPEAELEVFSELGAAHILAVSGFHVGVLASLAGWLMRPLGKRAGGVVTMAVIAAYCVLTGAHAPVVRASVLLAAALGGRMLYRQVGSLWTTSLAFILMLLINPAQLTSAGFQLSFGAVAGIVLVGRWLHRRLHPVHNVTAWLWSTFCMSVGAQTGVLLAQLYWYYELPAAGLLLNLLLMPFASVLISLYWLALAFLWWEPAAIILGGVSGVMTDVLLGACRWLRASGFGAWWTGQANAVTMLGWCMVMLPACVLVRLNARTKRTLVMLGALLMCVSFIPVPQGVPTYTQLSVGAADSAVLRSGGQVIVIDTGEDGEALCDHLMRSRLSVDTLIITHLHSDHAGGVAALLDANVPVAVCLIPVGAEITGTSSDMVDLIRRLETRGTEIRCVGRGDVITIPDGTITVLWPEHGRVRPQSDPNAMSLVLRADIRGTSLLLTGDATNIYEHYAAEPADILKVAHHGDEDSTSEAFLAAVSPQVAVVSNEYGNLDAPTAARLTGMPVYQTSADGAVIIRFHDGQFEITTMIR